MVQLDGVRQYVTAVLEGEDRAADVIAADDAEMRQAAAGGPNEAYVREMTRKGIWGLVDDEPDAQDDGDRDRRPAPASRARRDHQGQDSYRLAQATAGKGVKPLT